ncbi:peptide chain release factor N(5)-glutamine methyltransferase [Myroides odoratimimus]|uniref:peptide chain release factor N(5)-glutamine methyltransferase n=1 Tax=Myroides odoratimimus TaxID=76832 RepID=UPI0025762B54|nr:peptide chain release factor N(5)-glutamine methyltransferase [Myroides odoratimimus]MDM1442583.1 peptide chain release factor N(5)-glutamine methyltransferase [Myroides odoratimimus]MDM1453689.1 peptide chain release factor N(5)-glutamine methyltransferase [Myroides odoratimimus]MDM1477411.1 peptide chain release factor N(5)-glutamine methyltransferase [Myroides odoratimimus]MDM1483599.1 peptide chain release factor N(5)-glutamine methyltransferase [Myroides odoratimimus]MDM1489769.1 pepti
MQIKYYQSCFKESLTPIYDAVEAEQLFLLALEEIEGKTRIDLVMNPTMQTDKVEVWESVLEELKQEKPIQYIFGRAYFYGLTFKVNELTLIPRAETEELVEWIINSVNPSKPIRILDIGTGSGCIGITLANELPLARVTLMDVSDKALEVAKQNAVSNGVAVETILQDVLQLEKLKSQYDIIVSNPPYVRNLEKVEIKKNVLDYEPHLALFVEDNDPLIFYRKIALLANNNLQTGGMLFYEINQYLGEETKTLFESLDFTGVELRKDMVGNDRMIKAVKR